MGGGDYAIKSVETKSKLKLQRRVPTSDKISDKESKSMNQDIINQIQGDEPKQEDCRKTPSQKKEIQIKNWANKEKLTENSQFYIDQ